jgi:hypothetical protein
MLNLFQHPWRSDGRMVASPGMRRASRKASPWILKQVQDDDEWNGFGSHPARSSPRGVLSLSSA